MRAFGVIPFLIFGFVIVSAPPLAQAVEEGQLVKKDGKWEYVSTEDPGLKYLLLKGIINQQEYERGMKVLETKEYAAKPNYSVDVNNGLNIRVGSKFLLKMRLLTQVRYTYHTYNEGWGTIGDSQTLRSWGDRLNSGQSEKKAIPAILRSLELGYNSSAMRSIRTFDTTFLSPLTKQNGIRKAAAGEPAFSMPISRPGTFPGPRSRWDNSGSGSIARSLARWPRPPLRIT